MRPLDPSLVASLPEIAVLDLLASVSEMAAIALLAAHPCLEREDHAAHRLSADAQPPDAQPACCLADALNETFDVLTCAVAHYRTLVEGELARERRHW